LDARLATLLCKEITVVKSKEVKTGWYLAESSKEGYGSKRAVLLIMTMNVILYSVALMKIQAMCRSVLTPHVEKTQKEFSGRRD
jgi:hypothetical protein